jgi:hypothetical protein
MLFSANDGQAAITRPISVGSARADRPNSLLPAYAPSGSALWPEDRIGQLAMDLTAGHPITAFCHVHRSANATLPACPFTVSF